MPKGGGLMLYTPSHAELGQHPKTRRFARLLGVSIPAALGHLHLLWHFALKYAQDGDLSRFECDDLSDGVLFEGDPALLLAALEDAGWLDEGRVIHDWEEHGGKYVQRKEANAQRMREARAKQPTDTNKPRATHVQRTNAARVEPEKRRVEKRREEENRGEDKDVVVPPPRPMTPVPRRADARPALPSTDDLVEQLHSWADAKGVRDILRDEVERFHDYCLSGKNGKPVVYADYAAACRKWITNPSFDHAPRSKAPTPLYTAGRKDGNNDDAGRATASGERPGGAAGGVGGGRPAPRSGHRTYSDGDYWPERRE